MTLLNGLNCIVAILTSAACLVNEAPGRATTDVTAIVGGRACTAPDAEPIDDAAILIRDGRFEAVGPRSEVRIPADARIIDAGGCTVTAGFWNCHVHFMDFMGTPRWTDAATAPADRLAEGLREIYLQHGFTSVFDLGSLLANTVALRERIEAGEFPGPRILTTGMMMLPAGAVPEVARPYAPFEVGDADDGVDAVRKTLASGADAIKIVAVQSAGVPAPVPMNPDAIRAIADEAHRRGALVFTHPQTAAGVRAAVDGGVDIIAHTTEQGGPWDPTLIADMVERDVSLIPTIALYRILKGLRREATPQEFEAQVDQSGMVRQLRDFAAAGGRILFGTDVGVYAETDMGDEFRYMSMAGMDWRAILASLTTAPAERFGFAERCGRIVPGFDADLVILERDPAQDPMAFAAVRMTMRAGRVVYE